MYRWIHQMPVLQCVKKQSSQKKIKEIYIQQKYKNKNCAHTFESVYKKEFSPFYKIIHTYILEQYLYK